LHSLNRAVLSVVCWCLGRTTLSTVKRS